MIELKADHYDQLQTFSSDHPRWREVVHKALAQHDAPKGYRLALQHPAYAVYEHSDGSQIRYDIQWSPNKTRCELINAKKTGFQRLKALFSHT